nr:XRE family transcriptional regulator [uncultured Lachnoclostridium sp.]
MNLGDVIKTYRGEKNISMDDFAKISGLSKGYISMLEKNENPRTKEPIAPSVETVQKVAKAIMIDFNELLDMINSQEITLSLKKIGKRKSIQIPVLGYVRAGIPLEAVEDILDYEEISEEMAHNGEYFALKIKGNSMEPRINEGDVVIVRKQEDIESGDIAIVLVNGSDATCKKVIKHDMGISLVSFNQNYEPMMFSNNEIQKIPIHIVGRVVENRQKY